MARRESSRREFFRHSALAGTSAYVLGSGSGGAVFGGDDPKGSKSASPRKVSANDKINFACIGVGGKGSSDTDDAGRHGNVVALCDIDENSLSAKAAKFPKAKIYHDYRKMFEEIGDQIDAVTVSTPDHSHAPASALAMRLGKHCFCQKPLTWSIKEARVLNELAASKKLATQMGNQGTAATGLRKGAQIMRSGGLGAVKEIHVWTNRPIWPQGIPRPKDTPEVPKHVHWDEFLGPAQKRPYHPAYHPFSWRGWLDYGTGALGDMACHTLNVAYVGLDLVDPISAEVVDCSGIVDQETFPTWSVIKTEFGPRGKRPALTMYWYDGGKKLPESKRTYMPLLMGEKHTDSGLLVVGDKGSFYSQNDYGSEFLLLSRENYKDYKAPEADFPVSPGHFKEFELGIRGELTPMSNFAYAGKMTESILLGVVALRVGSKIEWDPVNLKAKNCPAADQYISREYRKGWEL